MFTYTILGSKCFFSFKLHKILSGRTSPLSSKFGQFLVKGFIPRKLQKQPIKDILCSLGM